MACYNYNGKKYTEEELLKELKANEKSLGNISGKWRYESNYEDLKLKEGTAENVMQQLKDLEKSKGSQLMLSDIVSEEIRNAYPKLSEISIDIK